MRKKLLEQEYSAAGEWLNLEDLAQVEISSEETESPIEFAVRPDRKEGWRASHPGEQVVRFVFDELQSIRRIRLVFEENEQDRTQEFSLAWSGPNQTTPREIVRQQYNFNPPQNIHEIEDYQVNLPEVKTLELRIRPDISDENVRASLSLIQIA